MSVVQSGHLRGARIALLAALGAMLIGLATADTALGAHAKAPASPRILVLSNRADLISGTSALVQIVLPRGVKTSRARVTLNGRNVKFEFRVRRGGRYEALVHPLRLGANALLASTSKAATARITITNHRIGGPVFAGPQVQPWVCHTQDPIFGLGGTKPVPTPLGPPTDGQCDTAPGYQWFYRSTVAGQGFQPYDPHLPPAASLIAQTTTDQGVTVPYIVRDEWGVEDRGLYEIAVLSDPKASWSPFSPERSWNHKLDVQFQGGAAPHHTMDAPPAVLDDMALSRGFMVASSGLLTQNSNSNFLVSAEATSMLKEHIRDTYGAIRYTIGEGCSGGSIQQQQLAADYPGLLDGIMPNCSFPDSWTLAHEIADCTLLDHYFASASGWSPAEMAAVEGTKDTTVCPFWDKYFGSTNIPSRAINCNLPPGPAIYDTVTNPKGIRCTLQDYQVALWGTRPDGFANEPLDNVGVQYGLDALQAGEITPAQFIDVNARVGGADIDSNFVPARMTADAPALPIGYRSGAVTQGRQLATVPIIDLRGSDNTLDIHTDFHSYQLRARLDADNGTHANQIIWTFRAFGNFVGITPTPTIALQSFLLMDRWLSKIASDKHRRSLVGKVIADKPSTAVDACFPDNATEVTDQASCAAQFPFFGDARIASGSPLRDDVLKCQLKPLNRSDYRVAFSDPQWAQVQAQFPNGVCNWSKPSVGQQPNVPWLTFAAGPGGRLLGAAPASRAVRVRARSRKR
jgi:hypothetical protein